MGREPSNALLKKLSLGLGDFDGEAETDEVSQEGSFSAFRKKFTSIEVAKRLDEVRATEAKAMGEKQAREGRGDTGTQPFGQNGLQNVVAPRLIPWLLANGYVPIAFIRERKPAHNTKADMKKAARDGRTDVKEGDVKRGPDGKTVVWKYTSRIRFVRWEDESDKSADLELTNKVSIILKDMPRAKQLVAAVETLGTLMEQSIWSFCHVWENPNATATINFTPMASGCPKQLTELRFNDKGFFYHRTLANKSHKDYEPRPSLLGDLKAKLEGKNGDTPPPTAS